MSSPFLRRLALLSVLAAVTTIAMKTVAYSITGSAGLLSDALESGVNLLAAVTAYISLWYAARPADATHTFGHEKIEFFASGLEGVLILLAGLGTLAIAVERLVNPQPLESLGFGLLLSGLGGAINLVVAVILLRAGHRHRSIVLEADGHHLMTDVYTTAAVIAGLGLVALTGWLWLDPLLALAVGLNILVTGFRLIRRSFNGLMDHALPPEVQAEMREAIRSVLPPGTDFHALRTRQAGRRTFAEFHLLVPGHKSVSDAHALSHRVIDQLSVKFPDLHVTIHIEPIDERESFETSELEQLGEVVVKQ
jgi:cation diffusion facilitator family transporter